MDKFFERMKKYADRWWYLPLVCLLAIVDLFVLFIPTEGMIVTTSMLRPRRWVRTAFFVTLASTAGAAVLALLTYTYGEPFVTWIAGENFFASATWVKMDGWIKNYGFWGLWFIAIGPLPQQPAILLCALAQMPIPEIALGVWLGRAPKYFVFSYIATKGPDWLKKNFGPEIENLKLNWPGKKKKEALETKKSPSVSEDTPTP